MFRGLATVFWAASLQQGMSVRQNLKTERSGQGAHLMNNIASVLDSYKKGDHQQLQVLLRAIASETPEVSATFKEVVKGLITTIETDIHKRIMDGKTETEDEILARISTLETAAGVANTGYDDAERADKNLYECMSSEKEHQEKIEEEKSDMDEAYDNTLAPCKNKDDNRHYERVEQAPMSFSCDFSVPDSDSSSCTKQMENLESKVQENLGLLDESSGKQVTDWNTFNDDCNHKKDLHEQATKDHENAVSAHESKQDECAKLKNTRDSEVCTFGHELQDKCAAYGAYNSIITDLEVAGGDHSQVDRRAEWADTEQTRCLLQAHYDSDVLSNPDTASQAIVDCVAATNFENQGGDLALDSKQSRVDAVMGPIDTDVNYLCEAGKTFSFFNGKEWIVSNPENPSSTDYKTEPFTPEIVLTVGEDSFKNPSTC